MIYLNIIFLRSNPVDPDSRVEKEVNALLRFGHSVRILAWDRNSKHEVRRSTIRLENGEVDIYRFGIPASFGGGFKKNLLPLLKFQASIYKWLNENKCSFDAIHACDFDTAFISSKIAFNFKKKFIYDIFDYYVDAFNVPEILKPVIEKKDKAIMNRADAVIICNEKRKKQIAGANPKKLVVIHNTPPSYDSKSLGTFNLNKDKIKIVYVGILDEGRLIKETAEIIKENLNYEYHVAGFGRMASLMEDMSRMYDNIFFYGKIPYIQALKLENSCDIMTALYDPSVPNNFYAAPNKFYEALMLGKPIIVVKNTGIDDIVKENNIGTIINYSKNDLDIGIKSLVNMRAEWENISTKMKSIYYNQYSWDKMEDRLQALYGDI